MYLAPNELKKDIRKVLGQKYESFKNSLNSICIEEEQRIHDNYKYFTYGSAQRRGKKRNKQVHSRYLNDRRDYTHNEVNRNHDYRQKQNNNGLCWNMPYTRLKRGVAISRTHVQCLMY